LTDYFVNAGCVRLSLPGQVDRKDVGGVRRYESFLPRTLAGRQVEAAVFDEQWLRVTFGKKEAS
jgi:hypothetical protein